MLARGLLARAPAALLRRAHTPAVRMFSAKEAATPVTFDPSRAVVKNEVVWKGTSPPTFEGRDTNGHTLTMGVGPARSARESRRVLRHARLTGCHRLLCGQADGAGFSPMQMLLMALAACSSVSWKLRRVVHQQRK
jgi:hypothetical protein